MLVKITGDMGHVYYINSDHIVSINHIKGNWSYTISGGNTRVSITPNCARRLLTCLRYIEARGE